MYLNYNSEGDDDLSEDSDGAVLNIINFDKAFKGKG